MATLTQTELDRVLIEHPGWKLANGALTREWKFRDFVAAMVFVNRIGALAEEADHHPDIDIRYNKVRLSLVSHDVGALTGRDARMVARIDREF